jgi:O-antigen/teichoic acid export membrane protein
VRPRFGSDILRFGSAVVLALALSVVQVFIVPRRLSVEAYGEFRVFLLYIGYLGVFHLGLVDGAFLRWVGRPRSLIRREWPVVLRRLVVMQLPVLAIAGAAYAFGSTGLPRVYVIALTTCAVAANLASFAGFSLQAAGDFTGAGRVTALPTALFAGVIVFLPIASLQTMLFAYIASFGLTAVLGIGRLNYLTGAAPIDDRALDTLPPMSFRSFMVTGLPVLGTGIATGLSQFADRILVSIVVPVSTYAFYGFASSTMAFGGAVCQTLGRVTLAHAARRSGAHRVALFEWTYALIATLVGLGLAAEPTFEVVVARLLPKYAGALPIVRALIPGTIFWICTSVVVLGALQTYGFVRRQFAVSILGTMLVATASGYALAVNAPLWGIAAAASSATTATWIVGTIVLQRAVPEATRNAAARFLMITMIQCGGLAVALALFNGLLQRTLTYAAIAAAPTWLASVRSRSMP